MKFSGFLKGVCFTLKKHSPEILTGIGAAGMVTTVVLAVKATPKAVRLLEEKKKEVKCEILTPLETAKTTWKCYIPTIVTGGVSLACIIGASSINARRNMALAMAYSLSESAMKDYKDKAVQILGKDKEKEIRDAVVAEQITEKPLPNTTNIMLKEDVWCYDTLSGRYFKSTPEKIERAVNEINRQLLDDMYVSVNEFYYELGLDYTVMGEYLGWNTDSGYVEVSFSGILAEDNKPCLALNFDTPPKYEYEYSCFGRG